MEAGPKLNALIATDVLKWTYDDGTHCERCTGNWYDEDGMPGELPDFSGKIAAAWLVVEKLGCLTLWDDGVGNWHCRFGIDAYDDEVIAGTAPLAICLAAREAVRI